MEAGKEISLEDIRTDGGTQPRAELDNDTLDEYRERMEEGDEFPPVVAFYDGVARWLADGFHRYFASKRAGFTTIKAIIHQGTQRDAQWYSFGANRDHGKRREPGDIKVAIERILADEQWAKTPLTKIADHIGCSQQYVSEIKAHLTGACKMRDRGPTEVTRNGKTYEINTANIGRKPTTEKTTEVIDTETGEVLEDAEIVTTTVKRQGTAVLPVRRGVGIEYGNKAIATLKEIPKDDALRSDALRMVQMWCADNA